jgi:formate dehydrogenase subunit delta
MDIHHLVKMANDISAFFEAEPDRAKGAKGVADHIRNFWDPRMRRAIFAHIDKDAGKGLHLLALSALQTHRSELGG